MSAKLPSPTRAEASRANSFSATLFDGTNATAHSVRVDLHGLELTVWSTDAASAQAPLRRGLVTDVLLSEPFAHAPRLLVWPDGATLEVTEAEAFTRAVGTAGMPSALVARLQGRWPFLVVALAMLLGLLGFAYMRGVPAAARWAAFALPASVEQRVGAEVLALLDGREMEASRVPADRLADIAAQFARAAAQAAPQVAYRLEFRRAVRGPGINAFALPGGTIVLLDGLVERTDSAQIIGVLGHELGHVFHKHGMRNVLQAAGIGALAGLVWGDFAGVATNVPLALGVLQYSRDFEREADDFAIAFLHANGLSVQPLIAFFGMVAELERKLGFSIPGFLSTHPSTPDRIERLKQVTD